MSQSPEITESSPTGEESHSLHSVPSSPEASSPNIDAPRRSLSLSDAVEESALSAPSGVATTANDEYGSSRLPPLMGGGGGPVTIVEPNPSSTQVGSNQCTHPPRLLRRSLPSNLQSKSPLPPHPANAITAHNRFHHQCCEQGSQRGVPSRDEVRAKSLNNAAKRRRARIQYQNPTPITGILSPAPELGSKPNVLGVIPNNYRRTNSATMLLKDQVSAYLLGHPDFLEKHILDHVSEATLNEWIIKRRAKKTSQSNVSLRSVPTTFLTEITNKIRLGEDQLTKENLLSELARNVAQVIGAEQSRVYSVNEDSQEVKPYDLQADGLEDAIQTIGSGSTMAAHAAKTRQPLRESTGKQDPRFPDGIQGVTGDYHVLVYPVHDLKYEQSLMALVEFARDSSTGEFTANEEEIVASYLTWGRIALSHGDICSSSLKQRKLQCFLLTVVKSIFTEMISMDSLIIKIMNFAQHLVAADRASLFLVDSKTNQLYARIFDIHKKKHGRSGHSLHESVDEPEDIENQRDEADFAREIRFPVGIGIAGFVAETGETLCVTDAYKDPRFNRSIDEQTGYQTRNILCMPISIRGQVIGVVQMVNKLEGNFTQEDEESFRCFSVYCGLALHHAKLYDKIRRSEQKYKVALEVLSYHNGSSALEVEQIISEPVPVQDIEISHFTFYALNMDDTEKVRKALFMFVDLFGLDRFEYETLARFLITVKKNYRQVAYHNWAHGFHVANSIYSILKASPGVFKPLESLAMFIGAICHDLDHRGFNNKFMIDVGSPLAAIYSTSTMEHHHFNMTVNILNQENHNIFAKLNPEEYKQVLGNIKHCILATDLALFFPNKARLTNILKEEAFSWDLPDHRMLAEALMMTASDLCSSSKPWELQLATVTVIYDEFYRQGDIEKQEGRVPVPIMNRKYLYQQPLHQGDVEKNLGWRPIPLFDRDHAEEVASMQIGFIGGICLPCYDLLVKVLPNTAPMQEQCQYNLNVWKKKAEDRKALLEEAKAADGGDNGQDES